MLLRHASSVFHARASEYSISIFLQYIFQYYGRVPVHDEERTIL
jgi:hypothetical protein